MPGRCLRRSHDIRKALDVKGTRAIGKMSCHWSVLAIGGVACIRHENPRRVLLQVRRMFGREYFRHARRPIV